MKLIRCDYCGDVVRLITEEWRKCKCGKIGGQYNENGLVATIGGEGRVVGLSNLFFIKDYPNVCPPSKEDWKKILKMRKAAGYAQNKAEVWYGDQKDEWQLIHIKNPNGPRVTPKEELEWLKKTFRKKRFSIEKVVDCMNQFTEQNKRMSNLALRAIQNKTK